ncbi:hypothetical protein NLG97_g4856 [Lecanicillium saksenae]|uniref:Uncharacterized protein n=1 Tax=Lecanicillium saksenae TaxID=468837 RepID=A0ACC1QVT8_9HYPO|nr:hypothetical protein NLG97_g4856 [Lecanicillium saksenae]
MSFPIRSAFGPDKRRVKCDEATPICRRCAVGRQECTYSDTLLPAGYAKGAGGGFSRHGSLTPSRRELQKRERRVFVEIEPPEWDYMQTVRFYFTFIRPGRAVENGRIHDPSFSPADATWLTMMVLGSQLGFLSKSRGKILVYGEGEELMARLWTSYTRYLSRMIQLINACIQESTPASSQRAIWYMGILVSLDIAVESQLWLKHVNGCLAYIQRLGGPETLVRANLFHNTTTPALQHSCGYADYTDEQLAVLLKHDGDFFADRPFPTPHQIIIIHLTRLRYRIATAPVAIPTATVALTAAKLFMRLYEVDIEEWAQTVCGFGVAADRAMAELHRDAIWLYALLSLPRDARLVCANSQPELPSVAPGQLSDAYDRHCSAYKSRVMSQLRKTYPELQYPPAINWTLVVAGVAAVHGGEEDRQFIDGCLYSNWQRPVGGASAFQCLQKLRQFWRSGLTGWEDCFYEPTPC